MTQIPPAMLPARRLGWVKDPIDNRDHDALKVLRTVEPPRAASNRDLVQIIDQGGLGSCTCNAVAQAVRAAEIVEQIESRPSGVSEATAQAIAMVDTPFLSRLFTYYLARAYEGSQHEDSGTYIRLVFQVINKYGFPPESAWPYSDDVASGAPFARMPSAEAFREAYDQRASVANVDDNLISYSRITGTGEARIRAVKSAVADRCLVAFGTPVSEDFCNGIGVGKPIDEPGATMKIAGGHAMTIAGYDENDDFEIANSWGKSFGQQGFIKFTRGYIASPKTNDLWIVKRAPLLFPKAA